MSKNLQCSFLVGIVYFILAITTQQLFDVFVIWPPAGIALAAVIVFGPKIIAAIFIANSLATLNYYFLILNVTFTEEHFLRVLIISSATCMSTYISYLLAPKNVVAGANFQNVHIMISRIFASFISLGVTSLLFMVLMKHLLGLNWAIDQYQFAVPWVIGDIVGAIIIAPIFYLILKEWPLSFQKYYSAEIIFLFLIMLCQSIILFGPLSIYFSGAFLQPLFLLLPMVWAAMRFPPLVSNLMGIMAFFFAWAGLNQNIGYFAIVYKDEKEIAIQLFFACMMGVSLVLQLLLRGYQNHQKKLTEIMEEKVTQRTFELEEAKKQAEYLSRIDSLTNLNNRRAFFEFGRQIQLQAVRTHTSFALIMLDIDYFKKINDSYGHDIGDIALQALADTLQQNCRDADVIGRLGGEEFAVIIPDSDLEKATFLAERIREAIAALHIQEQKISFGFTSSFGVAISCNFKESVADVLKKADHALYEAKSQGRNRVTVYQDKRTLGETL